MNAPLVQRAARCAALMAAMACGGPALADAVTLNFAGVVQQTSFDPFDPLSGAVVAGSPFYSYLNFDTAAVDAAPSPDLGSYTLTGFPYGFAPVVGSVLFPVMDNVNISIVDGADGGPDQYTVFAWAGTAGDLGDYFSISILLQDDSGAAFGSDALPAGMPDLSSFALRTFTLAGQYTDMNAAFIQYEIQGDLTVPEPTAASLVALALLGCLAANRSRRSRRSLG